MSEKANLDFNRNEDNMKLMISDLKKIGEQIKTGGGKKSIERHKKKANSQPASVFTF